MLLKRFVDMVIHTKRPAGFDGYLNSIHQRGLPGEPTYEEAKKDFLNSAKHKAGYSLR